MKLRTFWSLTALAAVSMAAPPLSAQVVAVKAVGASEDSTVTIATAKDVGACAKIVQAEWGRHYSAASKAKVKWNDTLDKAARNWETQLAKQCLVRFPLASAKPGDLRTIAGLYTSAQLRDSTKIVARMYVERAPNDSLRADALEFAVGQLGPSYSDSGEVAIVATSEVAKLATRLDALGAAYGKQQFNAHVTMARYYRQIQDAEKRFEHLSRALEIAPKLSAADRKSLSYDIGGVYTSLADLYGKKGESDKAKAILARGVQETVDLGEGTQTNLKSAMLVDNPSPPLVASNWFNAPEGTTQIDPKGKLSLVMITAHW